MSLLALQKMVMYMAIQQTFSTVIPIVVVVDAVARS